MNIVTTSPISTPAGLIVVAGRTGLPARVVNAGRIRFGAGVGILPRKNG